jgi:hypothetical protein
MVHHHRQPAQIAVAARRRDWPIAPLAAMFVLALAVLAAGCGAAASGTATDLPHNADGTHETWVTAVREGDVDAALALTDPELSQREQFAREAVSRMQDYLTSPASPTGALQDITVEPVSDGVGRSVWQFAQKRWCYRAELVSRAERWYVSRWGQTSVACP